jgi:CRP/FNR family cyclic AMP-dependent transcriptional regulator
VVSASVVRDLRVPVAPRRQAVLVPFLKEDLPLEWETLLPGPIKGKTILTCGPRDAIFTQGQNADSLFFVLRGKVRLAVVSQGGKEAIVATLGPGEFFGEGCLVHQPVRMATATANGECTLIRMEKSTMARLLLERTDLAGVFINHLLTRITRYEADLADQLFNSSEKRLARTLLLLSHFGPASISEPVVRGISQEHLAQMVGTTRSRINYFMNKFRKLGYVTYDAKVGMIVHRSLRTVTLRG